jgi:L-aspartate oxidase
VSGARARARLPDVTAPTSPSGVDLLVVGSGVAGLTAAVRAASHHGLSVAVVTKAGIDSATTRWAQGGIAAVLDPGADSTDLHVADTLAAGGGLCDDDAVRVLVEQGPDAVRDLIGLGAVFDRDDDGRLDLAREGGHRLARVVHAGGVATGVEVERTLVDAVHATAARVDEGAFVLGLLVEDGRCVGVRVAGPGGATLEVRARHTLLASGGAGQLFAVTTNPMEATADGVAMALRAGVPVADVEFVQFHPTALAIDRHPRPLLSEALRGDGALIRDVHGDRFVDEMLPRDQVSRAITTRMIEQGVDHCLLDVTGIERFAERFPSIAGRLVEVGLDPTRDLLPIAPAAHYLCGGVVTDLDGATALPGLWAAGEVACSGVHGANRLASNSLLEGLVFGARAVDAVAAGHEGPAATGAMRSVLGTAGADASEIGGRGLPVELPAPLRGLAGTSPGTGMPDEKEVAAARDRLQRAMTAGAGVVRDAGSLDRTAEVVEEVAIVAGAALGTRHGEELANLCTMATALLAAASARRESRGAHTRLDAPATDPELAVRLVVESKG